MVVGINTTLHPQERDPMPLVQEAGRTAGLVSCEKSPPTPLGFNPQTTQPVASCLLHLLCYPG